MATGDICPPASIRPLRSVPGCWLQACQAASVSRCLAPAKNCRSATPWLVAMAGLCRITSSSLAAVSSVKARISGSGGMCVRPVNRSRNGYRSGLFEGWVHGRPVAAAVQVDQ